MNKKCKVLREQDFFVSIEVKIRIIYLSSQVLHLQEILSYPQLT